MSPGATTLARIPRRAPSRATFRHKPMTPAFDASYAGRRLSGLGPATELMNTMDAPSGRRGMAARVTRAAAVMPDPSGLLGGAAVPVGTDDGRAFTHRGDGDGTPIADRRVIRIGGLGSGSGHEDGPVGKSVRGHGTR